MKTSFLLVPICFIAILVVSSFSNEEASSNQTKSANDREGLPQLIKSIPLRDAYDFAGEPLPMEAPDVVERLDRELSVNSYWHSSTLLHLKLSKKYFPIIEPILAAKGVPEDFKYLAVAESGLRNVTSPAGAKGLWQFLKTTGRSYGLTINSDVDERYHIEKSTQAAAEYLLYLKEKFGSWTLAAAAYNGGETRIKRLLEEQRARNYYELNLTEETMRYVFRIVAIKEIMSDPERFGFQPEGSYDYNQPEEFYLLEVNESIANWGDYARQYGSDYRTLKYHNPWLLSAKLENSSGKSYAIKLPK